METSSLTAPEGFAQSPDSAYWDGPEVRVETANGVLGAQAQWSLPTGVTYAVDMGYDDLTGSEVLRLAAALNALVRAEYGAVAS